MGRIAVLFLVVGAIACGSSSLEVPVVRFVDIVDQASFENSVSVSSDAPPLAEWRFEGDTAGWKVASGIQGLSTSEGYLVGKTSSRYPLLHLENTAAAEDADVLYGVEIRLRVSSGANLGVDFQSSDELDLEPIMDRLERGNTLRLTTPVVAGEEIQTYTMLVHTAPQLGRGVTWSDMRHIVVRPTDAEGAEFAIESIRLIFRREHLASIPSGVSWQGFGDVFRETLVTRAPEKVTFSIELGANPWLDLAIGTVEEGPVTFRIDVAGENILEQTVTTSQRWEERAIDLSSFSNRAVDVKFSVDADAEGGLGFWGAPAIRHRGARPGTEVASTLGNGPPRGVILIVADTLRRDHLELYEYGRPTAPSLTRMAEEGVLFSDNISQASWTKVSVASILTSLYPTTHGVDDAGDRISSVATTLAEVYREAGYATLSFASNGFVGQRTNLHQGFEVVFESPSLRSSEDENPSKTARACIDRLLPWLETHHEVPFFAFVHVVDPHSPFEPKRPYDGLWADLSKKAAFEERVEKVREHIQSPRMRRRGMPLREELAAAGIDPEDFVPYELDWYDGSIRGMDVEIGRVLERLRTLGIENQTLVAFVSDHGEEFLEHGRHWHGNSVYGEMVNVPLMVKWPGVLPEGIIVDETVESIDLMLTLLDLSGLAKPEAAQGDSLLPLIAEAAGIETEIRWHPRPVFAERKNIPPSGGVATRVEAYDRDVDSHAIIVDGWKLIHNVRYTGDYPEFELFEHDEDPLDLENVASEHPDIVERLAAQLEDWHQFVTAARLPEDEEAADGMSPQELERLRSLGYIQ